MSRYFQILVSVLIVVSALGPKASAQSKYTFAHPGNSRTHTFLARKSDPMVYKPIDYTVKIRTNEYSFISSSEDGKYMTITINESTTNSTDLQNITSTTNITSVLMNMELGKVILKSNREYYGFMGNQLLKTTPNQDYFGRPIATAELANIVHTTRILDIETLEPIGTIPIPQGENYLGNANGYIQTSLTIRQADNTYRYATRLYRQSPSGLTLAQEFPLTKGTFSADGTKISGEHFDGTTLVTEIYDIASGQLINKISGENGLMYTKAYVTPNNNVVVQVQGYDTVKKAMVQELRFIDLYSGQLIKSFADHVGWPSTNDRGDLMLIPEKLGTITLLDLNTMEIIADERAFQVAQDDPLGLYMPPTKVGNNHFTISFNGIHALYSMDQKKVVAYIFADEDDWAVIAADGRMDGTSGAINKLEWRTYSSSGILQKQSPIDLLFDKYFTPSLLPKLLDGEVGTIEDLQASLSKAPSVEIISPANGTRVSTNTVTVTVQAQSNGDPVKDILLYINNKLFGGGERGFKSTGTTKTFEIPLAVGENLISAKAISQSNYESPFDHIKIYYEGQQATSDLHMVAVGINQYLNSHYNLNYAVADAKSLTNKIKQNSTQIFDEIYVHEIYNTTAKRDAIINKLKEVASSSKPEDVFVFFYAGHGVLSETVNEFYLALTDVTQMYGRDDLLQTRGISAEELKDLISAISAQKQVVILDACQSGGAVETFASRGAAEEKAIAQLARSSGTVLLASTGSEQFASEFRTLGHGVFTYALLNGMSGAADGGSRDNKITVKELEAYLNDQIPILTQKHKGQMQFPKSWTKGMDFPLIIAQ